MSGKNLFIGHNTHRRILTVDRSFLVKGRFLGVLAREEARRIATNTAKLPKLLRSLEAAG